MIDIAAVPLTDELRARLAPRFWRRVVVMNLRGSACAYLMAGDYASARRDLDHAERIEKGRRDG